jgi:hypothetical protein
MLPDQVDQEVVFLGGKDYVPLFCSLTASMQNKKTIFFNSALAPDAPGCTLKKFPTSTRTNWHYECANALIEGRIILSQQKPKLIGDNSDERKLYEL